MLGPLVGDGGATGEVAVSGWLWPGRPVAGSTVGFGLGVFVAMGSLVAVAVGFGVPDGSGVGAGVALGLSVGVGAAVGFGVDVAAGVGFGGGVGLGVGRGVAVGLGVGDGLGVAVGADVGAAVGFGVEVAPGVGFGGGVGASVGRGVPVGVGVGAWVGVGAGVTTGTGVAVGVAVGAVVGVGVGAVVGVAVWVGVGIGATVGVGVGLGVGVGSGQSTLNVFCFALSSASLSRACVQVSLYWPSGRMYRSGAGGTRTSSDLSELHVPCSTISFPGWVWISHAPLLDVPRKKWIWNSQTLEFSDEPSSSLFPSWILTVPASRLSDANGSGEGCVGATHAATSRSKSAMGIAWRKRVFPSAWRASIMPHRRSVNHPTRTKPRTDAPCGQAPRPEPSPCPARPGTSRRVTRTPMPLPPFAQLLRPMGLVAVAMLLAACGLTAVQGPRSWSVAASDSDGHQSTINVSDRSGKVLDIEFDPLEAKPGVGVAAVPGQPNALDVSWVGGQCDASTTIDIVGVGAGLGITVNVEPDARPCDAIGVSNAIRLNLAQPIPPALVKISQEPAG